MYINVKLLCCTPETNIVLYVNYISVKKEEKSPDLEIYGQKQGNKRTVLTTARAKSWHM